MISKAEANRIATEQYDNIYSFCRSRLVSEEDASDITQEVFLLFQEKGDELEDKNIRSWLFSVADRKIKEEFRRRKTQSKLIEYEDITPDEEQKLLYELDDICTVDLNEIEAAKLKIFNKLTPEEQQLFIRIYQDHAKYSDIAAEINVGEKSIAVKAFRLRMKIRKYAELAFLVFAFLTVKLRF